MWKINDKGQKVKIRFPRASEKSYAKYVYTTYKTARQRPGTGLETVVNKDGTFYDRVYPQNFFADRSWDHMESRSLCRATRIKGHLWMKKDWYENPNITGNRWREKVAKLDLELAHYMMEEMLDDIMLNRNKLIFHSYRKKRLVATYQIGCFRRRMNTRLGNHSIIELLPYQRRLKTDTLPKLYLSPFSNEKFTIFQQMRKINYEAFDIQTRLNKNIRSYYSSRR